MRPYPGKCQDYSTNPPKQDVTVDSLIATSDMRGRTSFPSDGALWKIVRTYEALFRSQITTVPSPDPLATKDHDRLAATHEIVPECARRRWVFDINTLPSLRSSLQNRTILSSEPVTKRSESTKATQVHGTASTT